MMTVLDDVIGAMQVHERKTYPFKSASQLLVLQLSVRRRRPRSTSLAARLGFSAFLIVVVPYSHGG